MWLWREIGNRRWASLFFGATAGEYLRFVRLTSRAIVEPADIYDELEANSPVILALWHGEHLAAPLVRKNGFQLKLLASRHRDGEINAIIAERLGIGTIRGSGDHGTAFMQKGAVAAFQGMVRTLAAGCTVALSADVPKVSRVAGLGIIKVARTSGRPIYPFAAATSRRVVLDNWDRTAINLPFSRVAGIVGEPIWVARDADDNALEEARRLLEERLNAVTRRAYEIVDLPRGGK